MSPAFRGFFDKFSCKKASTLKTFIMSEKRIRIDFTNHHAWKRTDKDYQDGLRALINNECPPDLKELIISNNAYFVDHLDKFEQHDISAESPTRDLADKMELFIKKLTS